MAIDVNQIENFFDDILIRIYSQTGRDNSIIDLILKLEAQDTKDSFGHSIIAFGYIHLKDYKKADEHFQQAIKLNPNIGPPYYLYASSLALQNKQIEALDMLEEAIIKDIEYFLIIKDNYLDNIRDSEGFKVLMTKYLPEFVKE